MEIDRYHRQVLLPQIGPAGQARLAAARILIVGCGALGGVMAEQLVRAGIGTVRIADRDVVELTNLQRQVLFDEADVREQIPKAIAAARKLARINSAVTIEPKVVDVHCGNVEELAGMTVGSTPVDLILDGTDNADTRYLLNDVAVKHGTPWVYGACVGTEGRYMAMHPPHTACLRCIFPQPPAAGELPTCDTAGVLGSVPGIIASLQATAALKILLCAPDDKILISLDVWTGRFRTVSIAGTKQADCVACGKRRFEFLDHPTSGGSMSLCGRNAVQIRPPHPTVLNLDHLAEKLASVGEVQTSPYLLRCRLYGTMSITLTVFPDGRALVHGLNDPTRARSVYAQFLGL